MEATLHIYTDENHFRLTLGEKNVHMFAGELEIDGTTYEEHEDDATYPLARALARALYLTAHMRED